MSDFSTTKKKTIEIYRKNEKKKFFFWNSFSPLEPFSKV